jgi:hypothetical protein
MKKLLILLSFLILTSVAHSAINKNDPNLPKVVDQYNKSFEGVGKQASYLKKYASGQMDTMVNQINGSSQVSNRIKDSIADSETGRKVNVTANVTQTANKAKVAEALAERFKNAGKYAKNLGKASLPAFVGTAAFHGLMNGVDYVMDPKNNQILKKPDPESEENKKYTSPYSYSAQSFGCPSYSVESTLSCVAAWFPKNHSAFSGYTYTTHIPQNEWYGYGYRAYKINFINSQGNSKDTDILVIRAGNPDYKPDHVPESVPATDAEILAALKKALESNNPALAAAIAEAIKAAYTPDNSLGQSLVDIPANGTAMDATDSAVDAVRKAGKSTGEEPTSGGKPGYYKITDGDKTIEGYVYPTDGTASGTSDSNTVTNPDGSTTTTGTTATNWPNFCDWAGVVCEFIDWVKEDPEVEDELELPEEELEKQEIDKDLLNVSGHSCPNALQINFKDLPFNMTFNKSIDIQPFCNTIEPLKYVLQLITICLCAFMFLRL